MSEEISSAQGNRIEVMDLKSVHPYWRNPRDNENAVEPVKESIRRYGYLQPIVVDTHNVIIVGHTRFQALMELGYEQAEVIIADKLDDDTAKQYRIADNKAAEYSQWDDTALIQELRELALDDVQPFFDEDLEALVDASVGQDIDLPDQEEVDKEQEKADDRFTDRSEQEQADKVLVICPGCAEEFYISHAEIQRREKYRADNQ